MATKAKADPAVKGQVEAGSENAGEHWGKVVGPSVDTSFHAYEFNDPNTGEPIEPVYVKHDVPVKNNADGSIEYGKVEDQAYVPGSAPGAASGGESGETNTGTSK